MAETYSNMMPLGTKAPNFDLVDAKENRTFTLGDVNAEKGLLIVFGCNHCPFVLHILPKLNEVIGDYLLKGISALMINSNDPAIKPEDSFEKMTEFVEEHDLNMPYLFDETQEVAKAYDAACTPDIFLFNKDLELVYRGQFDDSRPGKGVATGADLIAAMDALVNDRPIAKDQKPSIGCNIKWNES